MCGSRIPVVCSRRLRGQVGAVSLAVGIAGRCACLGGALNRSGFSGDFGIVPRRSVQKCRRRGNRRKWTTCYGFRVFLGAGAGLGVVVAGWGW